MAKVRVWEDDPLAGVVPVERAQAKLPKAPMGITIDVPAPPAKLYDPGTPEFRYWQAADALARGVAFWKAAVPKGTSWQVGKTLPVRLDAGDKLNAVYTRGSSTPTWPAPWSSLARAPTWCATRWATPSSTPSGPSSGTP